MFNTEEWKFNKVLDKYSEIKNSFNKRCVMHIIFWWTPAYKKNRKVKLLPKKFMKLQENKLLKVKNFGILQKFTDGSGK